MYESRDRFPATRHSVVHAIGADDPDVRREAFDVLIASYWRPVYKYLRLRSGMNDDAARDATQGFFASMLERDFLQKFDAGRAKFRTWLRRGLDAYVANERKAASRLKRGGSIPHLSLDFEDAEGELQYHDIAVDADVDEFFHREWVRGLMITSVDELRTVCEQTGRTTEFEIFQRYDLVEDGERPTYVELADRFGVKESKVTNSLHSMRKRFRTTVLDHLRALCVDGEEFEAESRALFGPPR